MDQNPDHPIVPLGLAYSWICPVCRQKNYVDPILESENPDEIREAFIRLGLIDVHQPLPEGAVFVQPASVVCGGCSNEFEAEDDTGVPIGDLDDATQMCGCFEFSTGHLPTCPHYESES